MPDIETLSYEIAQTILSGFGRHFTIFQELTAKAKICFAQAKWQQMSTMAKDRIYFYDQRVKESVAVLHRKYQLHDFDEDLWLQTKQAYTRLIINHQQPELAETFFNSVFCSSFDQQFYHNQYIFVQPSANTNGLDFASPISCSCSIAYQDLAEHFKKILLGFNFNCKFTNFELDIQRLTTEFKRRITAKPNNEIVQIEIITEPFFRNKAAYIIGRVVTNETIQPLCIAILNDGQAGLRIDALLMAYNELSLVFSFTRSYFMVATQTPSAIVAFLETILPSKNRADLYSSIGFHKQGKTLLYRMLLRHIKKTTDKLIIAPGVKGMVMSVFTFPVYPYVFKLIKDNFTPPKDSTRELVKQKYRLVKNHKKVGRLSDTWEFSNAAFPIDKLDDELLAELKQFSPSSLTFIDNLLIIKHLYIEQKMQPLNIYLEYATPEQVDYIMRSYGFAIKELIKADIFPGDMLFKNFGVTRQNRVVFYDYDEITTMDKMNFRKIPIAKTLAQEMVAEPWYYVDNNDVFPEEFGKFWFARPDIKQAFLKYHADLLQPKYWQQTQEHLSTTKQLEAFPYAASNRMGNIYPLKEQK